MYLQRTWRTMQNGEKNNTIQIHILIVKDKSNEQLILTQIVHGKGEHVCLNNIRQENYNQILDVEDFFLQFLWHHFHTNSTIFTSLTHKNTLFLLYQQWLQQHKGALLVLLPPFNHEGKLVYIVQRGPKRVDIFWEEGEEWSLDSRVINTTYSR